MKRQSVFIRNWQILILFGWDNGQKERFDRSAILKRLNDNEETVKNRMTYFESVFDSFIYQNIEAQCNLYNYRWDMQYPEIVCCVGYLPFYPRSAEDKCFYVSYQDEERVFSGAVHEINHMIFFEKWKQIKGGEIKEPFWPDPLWYLEEIIVNPKLNDERVKPFTLFENKTYPQFYQKTGNGQASIMEKILECYSKKERIEDFMLKAYDIVCAEKLGGQR